MLNMHLDEMNSYLFLVVLHSKNMSLAFSLNFLMSVHTLVLIEHVQQLEGTSVYHYYNWALSWLLLVINCSILLIQLVQSLWIMYFTQHCHRKERTCQKYGYQSSLGLKDRHKFTMFLCSLGLSVVICYSYIWGMVRLLFIFIKSIDIIGDLYENSKKVKIFSIWNVTLYFNIF